MNKNYSAGIAPDKIKINDSFWNEIIERVRTKVLPFQYSALWDRVEGAEKSFSVENFIKAGKIVKQGKREKLYPCDKWFYNDENAEEGAFHGWVFQDTDVYKWLEAAAYSLISFPDEELRKKADELIELVCAAQLENGYLDTLYIINNPDLIFTNLRDYHELYCFGHLAEAGFAYYIATKDKRLLNAALKFADLICSRFGKKSGQLKGYPGHEIAEMAFVKLYELTGEKRYIETAEFFIDERGKRPYYFDLERGKDSLTEAYHYNQAHIEPRLQTEAVGHAVRGTYLYSGMADIARIKNDSGLYSACQSIWNNIENKKLYITGGIGATVHGEAFSFDYDLPNDLAYCETCASIGLIFFASRMARLSACSNYGDVAERALYNTVLSSMAEDGKSFFYVNPLEVNPAASQLDERKKHIKPVRQKWFSCACCPPNLARLVMSLGTYAFSENENEFFIHHPIGAEVNAENARLKISSSYAENGCFSVEIEPKKKFLFAVRLPSWTKKFEISMPYTLKNGYAYFEIEEKTEISFSIEMKPRLVKCSENVRVNIGRAAVMKGMFVYCAEGADNGSDIFLLRISKNPDFCEKNGFIISNGYKTEPSEMLYSDYEPPKLKPKKIKFLPYYKWGNRGENEMQIYFNVETTQKEG